MLRGEEKTSLMITLLLPNARAWESKEAVEALKNVGKFEEDASMADPGCSSEHWTHSTNVSIHPVVKSIRACAYFRGLLNKNLRDPKQEMFREEFTHTSTDANLTAWIYGGGHFEHEATRDSKEEKESKQKVATLHLQGDLPNAEIARTAIDWSCESFRVIKNKANMFHNQNNGRRTKSKFMDQGRSVTRPER